METERLLVFKKWSNYIWNLRGRRFQDIFVLNLKLGTAHAQLFVSHFMGMNHTMSTRRFNYVFSREAGDATQ